MPSVKGQKDVKHALNPVYLMLQLLYLQSARPLATALAKYFPGGLAAHTWDRENSSEHILILKAAQRSLVHIRDWTTKTLWIRIVLADEPSVVKKLNYIFSIWRKKFGVNQICYGMRQTIYFYEMSQKQSECVIPFYNY